MDYSAPISEQMRNIRTEAADMLFSIFVLFSYGSVEIWDYLQLRRPTVDDVPYQFVDSVFVLYVHFWRVEFFDLCYNVQRHFL